VDLTNAPGIRAITAQTILCEIGTDVSRFRNASAFASWLGLRPEKKVSGGKVLPRAGTSSTALRTGASSLHHAKDGSIMDEQLSGGNVAIALLANTIATSNVSGRVCF